MPQSKKPGWVDWKGCPARQVIIDDLCPGGVLHNRDFITAEEIFPWYKQFPAFKDVVLDQFKARLKDHRKAAAKDLHKALQHQQFFEHDREIYVRETHNERGEPIFDLSPARILLSEDVKNKIHERMSARQLQDSRKEYQIFKRKVFSDRIRQEVRLQKYHHYLDLKRKALLNGESGTVEDPNVPNIITPQHNIPNQETRHGKKRSK